MTVETSSGGRRPVEATRTNERLGFHPNRNVLRLPLTALNFNVNRPEVHATLMQSGVTRIDQVYALQQLSGLDAIIGGPAAGAVSDRLSFVMDVDVHNEDPAGLAKIKGEINAFADLPFSRRAKIAIVTQLGIVTPGEFATVTPQQLEMMDLSTGIPPEKFSSEEVDRILDVAGSLRSPKASSTE